MSLRRNAMKKPIAYFDLDGTLRDTYHFVYPRAHQVTLFPGITGRLTALRNAGYLLVGITNQGGVSLKQITQSEVELANDRTQELLGEARLDLVLYCPHHRAAGGPDCDCKKPAPGMLLDALSALSGSTLDGAFVVGDNPAKDKGAADMLALPFVLAETFRAQSIAETLGSLPKGKARTTSLVEDRVIGAILGMATGDAFAAPVEFWERARVRQKYPDGLKAMTKSEKWAMGEYTDDTQMALLISESLLAENRLDPSDIAKRFRRWAQTSKDVGLQTLRVMGRSGYVAQPEGCARLDYQANPTNAAGNGAVMRCTPVALFHADSLPMLLADSRRSARITHGDPKAQSSCVLINVAIRHLMNGGGKEEVWKHGMRFLTPFEKAAWSRLDMLPSLGDDQINSGGYTVSTVEAAFWCFEHSETFAEAIELAASLGDDADTVAAVTGSLAGAYYGYEAIPIEWRKALMNVEQIRTVALRLAAVAR
jgi:ADP-ribosyl-[dinitrogen reductase] hydrolase